MDKKDFSINKVDPIKFEFQSNEIEVMQYIPEEVKLELSKRYIQFLAGGEDHASNYFVAEWSIILGVIDYCTNINVFDDKDGKTPMAMSNIVESGLWDRIRASIINYNEFRKDLKEVYQSSIGFAAIEKKTIELLNSVAEIDVSADGIADLMKKFNQTTKKFKKDFPSNGVVK